jgi:hypothetical protein
MQRNNLSSKKSEAGDKLAHLLAGILIRGMQRIAVRLNNHFNQFPRKTQLRYLWTFVTIIGILIGFTSLKFTSLTAAKITGGYRPITIGKPSAAIPNLIQDQVNTSLIKSNDHEHHH